MWVSCYTSISSLWRYMMILGSCLVHWLLIIFTHHTSSGVVYYLIDLCMKNVYIIYVIRACVYKEDVYRSTCIFAGWGSLCPVYSLFWCSG